MSWPESRTEPAGARRSSPESAAISSCWPLPDTPAMPTISPALTCSASRDSVVPKGSACGRSSPSTASTTSPGVAGRLRSAGGSAPIISFDSEALVSCVGSTSPVTRPPRSTVQ